MEVILTILRIPEMILEVGHIHLLGGKSSCFERLLDDYWHLWRSCPKRCPRELRRTFFLPVLNGDLAEKNAATETHKPPSLEKVSVPTVVGQPVSNSLRVYLFLFNLQTNKPCESSFQEISNRTHRTDPWFPEYLFCSSNLLRAPLVRPYSILGGLVEIQHSKPSAARRPWIRIWNE